MPVRRGSTPITDIRRGSTLINEVRRGSTLVWARTALLLRDDFNRDDADTLGPGWTSLGSTGAHQIGVENNYARVRVPEGLIGGFFALSISRARFNTPSSSDNGYIECRMSTKGDGFSPTSLSGFGSQLWAKCNTGVTSGVGIEMSAGSCRIVSKTLGVDMFRANGGNFQAGDVLRLTFTGTTHTLFRNGVQVATWTDTGNAVASGASFRSMSIRADGGKDLLGPRRFSPAFDYVEMG